MAELADAADSKSAGLRPMRVQVPLPAPFTDTNSSLRQMVQIAGARRALRRRDRWGHPRWIGEIEEFRHVHLRGVALGEARQIEARLDELKNCGVIGDGVRNVVLLGKRRDH